MDKVSPSEKARRAWITKRRTGFTGIKKGVASPLYKKTGFAYSTVHSWLIRTYGKATYCSNDKAHVSKRFDWANISGEYKRDISDYKPLCIACHHALDNIYSKRPKDMYKRMWKTRRENVIR